MCKACLAVDWMRLTPRCGKSNLDSEAMFHELIGTLVWLSANGLYIDLRRKGRGGLARIIFFFMGMPATWLWLFLVSEGKKSEELQPPRDDYHDLLAEIRRDRSLGAGPREDADHPDDDA